MNSIRDLQLRWDNFLQKITHSFENTLAQAEPALMQMIEDDPTQTQPVLVGWYGLRTQLQDLISKIGNTWQDTVSPQMEAIGYEGPGYDWMTECNKYSDTEATLRFQLSRAEIIILGKCAEVYYAKAVESEKLNFRCKQCSSPISVSSNIFRSHYENCTYCNTVNTYEPSTRLKNIEWFATDNLAAWRNIGLWEEKEKLGNEKNRKDPRNKMYQQSEEQYHRALQAYIESYLKERIRIIPELQDQYQTDKRRFSNY